MQTVRVNEVAVTQATRRAQQGDDLFLSRDQIHTSVRTPPSDHARIVAQIMRQSSPSDH